MAVMVVKNHPLVRKKIQDAVQVLLHALNKTLEFCVD
jgi:hypothetical protein